MKLPKVPLRGVSLTRGISRGKRGSSSERGDGQGPRDEPCWGHSGVGEYGTDHCH